MSSWRQRKDFIFPEAQPSSLNSQIIRFRIKQERKRLEGIWLFVDCPLGATTLPTQGANHYAGYAGMINRVRLNVDDINGSRDVVNTPGWALLSYNHNNHQFIDRRTQCGYSQIISGLTLNTTLRMAYWIPVRNSMLGEPAGNLFSIPLGGHQKGCKSDPILEVTLANVATEVFTAVGTLGNPTMKIQLVLRDAPDDMDYVPSELVTDPWSPSSVSGATYNFANRGLLTQCLVQTVSALTLTSSVTRLNPHTAGGTVEFVYARDQWIETDQRAQEAASDQSRYTHAGYSHTLVSPDASETGASGAAFAGRNWPGEMWFDFLADMPTAEAFSANSLPDLRQSVLGGDSAKLVFRDYIATTALSYITSHRILPSSEADIAKLSQFAKIGGL